ncbi:MAG: hypothetical protein RI883_122 [Bacteroidota bacterium]|jgi:dipeptidyl aminopeptidase/acylaminoacyl peptidase
MRFLLFIVAFVAITNVFGQKKIIDHTAYNDWKKNENQQVSNDGKYISYEINPHRGDGFMYLYNTETAKLDSFPRSKEAKFSFGSDYLVFKIQPGFDTLRNCELNKVDKKKWPKDSLGIYLIAKDTLIKVSIVKSFSVEEDNNWMTYLLDENEIKSPGSKNKKKKKKKPEVEYKSEGKVLTAYNPISEIQYQFKDVTDFSLSDKGTYMAFIEHKKEKVDSFQLVTLDLKTGTTGRIEPKFSSIKSLSFNEEGKQLAFLTSTDTTKLKTYNLNLYQLDSKINKVLVDSTSTAFPKEESVSDNRTLLFTDDERFLYFGVTKRPEKEVKDSLLESEKVDLDIWHYQDTRLQSQQLIELKRDQKKTDLYVYHLLDGKILKLSTDTLNIRPTEKQLGDYLFASSDERYQMENQWEVPNLEDHYRISLVDGSIERIKTACSFNGILSPKGNYYSYFDGKKANYYLIDLQSKKEVCMTCSSNKVNWQTDVNGMPMTASPFGVFGYSNDEKSIFIQSQYDVWNYSIGENRLESITNGEGVQGKIRMQPKLWSTDSLYVDYENLYIEGFDEQTKGTHLFNYTDHGDHMDLVEKYYTDHTISFLSRSKNKETIVFRKMSLQDYPEVRFSKSFFKSETVISSTNLQQSEFNWASVELINWKSYDGIPLEGLLYKPENYDPNKKYPLLIYYYELYSDDLHNHYTPKPTASIIYPTEYASAGYVVFIPDVRYKIGHPAKSAYDCIMSGTDRVLKLLPNIDSTKMGLQGQSWGGYQTAQLITMTKRYAAAMAGAPVSNMFSAYGGIRWGSGVNRQFQYERTQSRIGKTIWEAPELYVENSPLFHIPNITTPLLIMSNDKDGAVPWYQGIEMFTGMKRLGKPCWMLNYNGDDHNLMENANRIDLSIRMRQFFDYYLLDKPAPKWLTDGIPATVKGKELRYE